MPPARLLAILHGIERQFGRVRRRRWGLRSLDLDLLGTDQRVLPDVVTSWAWSRLPSDRQGQEAPDHLVLPHPRMQDRGFVLIPLAEIAPTWRHPLTGRSVAQMAADLPRAARAGVRVLGGSP